MPIISFFVTNDEFDGYVDYKNMQGETSKGHGRLRIEIDTDNARLHVVDELDNGDFVFALEGTRVDFQKGKGGKSSHWRVNRGKVTIYAKYSALGLRLSYFNDHGEERKSDYYPCHEVTPASTDLVKTAQGFGELAVVAYKYGTGGSWENFKATFAANTSNVLRDLSRLSDLASIALFEEKYHVEIDPLWKSWIVDKMPAAKADAIARYSNAVPDFEDVAARVARSFALPADDGAAGVIDGHGIFGGCTAIAGNAVPTLEYVETSETTSSSRSAVRKVAVEKHNAGVAVQSNTTPFRGSNPYDESTVRAVTQYLKQLVFVHARDMFFERIVDEFLNLSTGQSITEFEMLYDVQVHDTWRSWIFAGKPPIPDVVKPTSSSSPSSSPKRHKIAVVFETPLTKMRSTSPIAQNATWSPSHPPSNYRDDLGGNFHSALNGVGFSTNVDARDMETTFDKDGYLKLF
jgi:hypothetical protein